MQYQKVTLESGAFMTSKVEQICLETHHHWSANMAKAGYFCCPIQIYFDGLEIQTLTA